MIVTQVTTRSGLARLSAFLLASSSPPTPLSTHHFMPWCHGLPIQTHTHITVTNTPNITITVCASCCPISIVMRSPPLGGFGIKWRGPPYISPNSYPQLGQI